MKLEPSTCPSCGAELPSDAPKGFCPRCLYRMGFEDPVPSHPTAQPGSSPLATCHSSLPPSFGDYELLEEIGHGGMGVVYKARQKSLDRMVALKLLLFGPHAPPESVKRFRAEAVATAALQHPHIVAIHEVGFCEGQHFIAMDHVEGQSLSALIRGSPLPARRAAGYVRTIAEAIHYAHEHGILHRDLKPANVLIDMNDQPRVTDFGLARRLKEDSELTVTGQVLGSPNYMPPEQAAGKRGTVSRRTDVYALGAILYHALTGRPPFVGEGLAETVQQVLNVEPVSPRVLNPSVPADLETVCLKCLEKESAKRYATAQLLAEELGRFLEGKPVLARPVGPAGKAWRWGRRNPRLAAAVGLALLSLLIGLAGVSWQWRRAEAERARAEAGELFARQNTYAADMLLAQHALTANNRRLAVSLLEKHRPATNGKSKIQNPKSEIGLRGWEWRYLWQLCRGDERFTLHQYPVPISALTVSKDGKTLAVRKGDEVGLWNLDTRRPLTELPNAATEALAFSPTSSLLAVGSRDADGRPAIALWDLSDGRLTKTLPYPAEVRSVAYSPDGTLLATFDNRGGIAVVEWASGQSLTNFTVRPPRRRPTGVVVFSPEGSRLAVGEDYGGIQLVRLRPGTHVQVQMPSTDGATALVFSPDAELLAAAFGGTICLCNSRSGEVLAQWTNHTEWVTGLAFTPDGRQLVSASGDWTIQIRSVADRSEIRRLWGSREGLAALAPLPDGKTMVSGGTGGSVCFWDATARSPTPAHTNLAIAFPLEAMSDLARQDLVGGTQDRKAVRRSGIAFTTDSRSFLATDPNGVLGIWEVQSLRQTERLPALGSNLWGAALSPDGHWLAVGDAAGTLRIWDWTTRRAVTDLALPFEFCGGLRFSRSGKYLLARAMSNEWGIQNRIWRVSDWKSIPLTKGQSADYWPFDLSPDDRFLAAGYGDGLTASAVKLWRFPSGQYEATFTTNKATVCETLFSPDGRVLIATSWDGTVEVWDVLARQKRTTLQGHLANVWGAAFSPDGRRLATGGRSSRDAVKLWDVEAHRELLTLTGEGEFFLHVTFSADGNTLAATAMSGMANLWRAPSWEEIEAAEKRPVVP